MVTLRSRMAVHQGKAQWGDALGVPFLVVLMRAFSADGKARASEVDPELDHLEQTEPGHRESTLWWANDPRLRERFQRG